ncbi:MAG: outer membrane lipoprotein-sorting protein [Acidobacteria bacterium]|jgi:outer membrane lipoprotein-sorting protein|nr:outer membrane lipoprotein-sorting protein [Acidobacteriota bacterium]
MKKICTSVIFIFIYLAFPGARGVWSQETPGAEDILQKIDKNMVFETARSESDMIITIKNRTIIKNLVSYAHGNKQSYIEFINPARDKGTKILRNDEVIKIYYPSAERVMRISGHMLRQGMMGSDFSYEDMTERAKKLREEYNAEVKGEEEIDGVPCYLLVMTSKLEKQTYFTRKAWVDRHRFLVLKEELYAKSGKLLKILKASDVKDYKGRFYPTRLTMEDKLRQDSKTEMVFKKIEFDVVIPEETFSERQLLK